MVRVNKQSRAKASAGGGIFRDLPGSGVWAGAFYGRGPGAVAVHFLHSIQALYI